MLVQLTMDQVSRGWKDIKLALESTVPVEAGESQAKFNNILTALLEGVMQCWASWRQKDGGVEITALVIAQPLVETFAEVRSVLVYSVYSVGTTREEWVEGMNTFFRYYKSKGFHRVVGYSNVDSIIKHAHEWGCDVRSFISYKL